MVTSFKLFLCAKLSAGVKINEFKQSSTISHTSSDFRTKKPPVTLNATLHKHSSTLWELTVTVLLQDLLGADFLQRRLHPPFSCPDMSPSPTIPTSGEAKYIYSTTLSNYFHFLLLYTSSPLHLRDTHCHFLYRTLYFTVILLLLLK